MSNDKVLLINSPVDDDQHKARETFFPLGLLSLATVLRANGIEASILDVNNEVQNDETHSALEYIDSAMPDRLKDASPDFVGIGALYSGAFRNLVLIARTIRSAFPDTPIAVGGIHATLYAKEILNKYESIDYVIVGEGEYSFLELVKSKLHGGPISGIDGIAYRQPGGTAVRLNPKTQYIENLDELPHPDYSLLDTHSYRIDTSGWYNPKRLSLGTPFSVITSRSCPNRCSFCSMHLVHGPKIRFRSPENVLDELEHLYHEYDVRHLDFMDDNTTLDKKRAMAVFEGIVERNMDVEFAFPNGVSVKTLDAELVDAMIRAGMVRVSLAVETGSEFIRNKVMRKHLSNQKVFEVMDILSKYKHLFIIGYFIAGMPHETDDTLNETYDMITELPFDSVSIQFATPYPGTELFNWCRENNLLSLDEADYMEVPDHHYVAEAPHFTPLDLEADTLVQFRNRCNEYFAEKRRRTGIPGNYPFRSVS